MANEVQNHPSASLRETKGYGIDSDFSRRPGVPMESEPHPAQGSHWKKPDRQIPRNEKLKRAGLDKLTPVFGTAVPPRGFSGVMRRSAYLVPEYRASHWLLLLLADRVDVIESKVMDSRRLIIGSLLFGAGLFFVSRQLGVFNRGREIDLGGELS